MVPKNEKNITIAMHPSISAETLQKKHQNIMYQLQAKKKTSYSTSIRSRSICLKNRTKFEISAFLNYPSTPHLDPWCFNRLFSHHIFTTRWPRHLSAARSPNLRHRSLIRLPMVYHLIGIYNVWTFLKTTEVLIEFK